VLGRLPTGALPIVRGEDDVVDIGVASGKTGDPAADVGEM
jgi:hypothetical protein